jgi:protein ImuA
LSHPTRFDESTLAIRAGTPMDTQRSGILRELNRQLRRLEQPQTADQGEVLSSGIPAVDRLLPDRGLRRGMLLEWLSAESAGGAGTLAWMTAAAVQRQTTEGACIAIDPLRTWYPPALVRLGIDLDRLLVVQPARERDTLWALEQSLRCRGVSAVMARLERVRSEEFRRLQLAAETGGAVGFLLRPAGERAQPSWADVRLLVEPLPRGKPKAEIRNPKRINSNFEFRFSDFSRGRLLRLELLHCRGRFPGETLTLEIDDVTGIVRVASRLAAAKSARHAAGA